MPWGDLWEADSLCVLEDKLFRMLEPIEEIIQEVAIICVLYVKTEDSAQNKLLKG